MTPAGRSLAVLAASLAAACSAVERPTQEQLTSRIRVRIVGREIESITSADYMLFLAVRTPDGERVTMRARAPLSTGSEGLALILASSIERRCELPDTPFVESLESPETCEDFVLPPGYRLDFAAGGHFAYRIDGDTMRADPAPEIRIGCLLDGERRYVDLPAADGPELPRTGRPPGFDR